MFQALFRRTIAAAALFCCGLAFGAPEIEIPRTLIQPVLDGQADAVYVNAAVLPIGIMTEGFRNLIDKQTGEVIGYWDAYAWAHLLWDDGNLYMFVRVNDDSLRSDSQSRDDWYYGWTDDGLEIAIDPFNDKSAEWDGNDLKFWTPWHPLGIKFDRTPSGYNAAGTGIHYAFSESDKGLNFEVVVPFADLGVASPAPGWRMGFDISYMDDDGYFTEPGHWFQAPASFMDCAVRWAGGVHNQPVTWGTLILSGKTADHRYPVLRIAANEAPSIDGLVDPVWNRAYAAYHTWDGYFIDATSYYGADDAFMTFRMLWDDANLYLMAECVDDILYMDAPNYEWYYPWTDDMFEILIDPFNDKTKARDPNDVKFFMIPHTPEETYFADMPDEWKADNTAIKTILEPTDYGYYVEARIPFNEMKVQTDSDTLLGFACGLNEDDGQFVKPPHWFAPFKASFMCGKHEWGAYDESKPETWGEIILKRKIDTHVAHRPAVVPASLSVPVNYPNPFNSETTIRFALPKTDHVRLVIFDSVGREVAVLLDGKVEAGEHRIRFNADGLASGLYFYRLAASDATVTGKMILMK